MLSAVSAAAVAAEEAVGSDHGVSSRTCDSRQKNEILFSNEHVNREPRTWRSNKIRKEERKTVEHDANGVCDLCANCVRKTRGSDSCIFESDASSMSQHITSYLPEFRTFRGL